MSHANAAIEMSGLTRSFRVGSETVHAVRDVTLTVPESRLTVIRGKSGSGKTTLLNLLGLLDRPSAGTLRYAQEDVLRMSDHERDLFRRNEIGFIYQTIALVALMTAYENVDFRMRIARVSAAEREERVRECLHLVGLSERMTHRPFEMSGGEQQRVAIARAIAHRPRVIFADEPTAELDTVTGIHVVGIFRRLIEEEGITVVMTTHDPAMMELADHVIEMQNGYVVEHADDPV